MTDQSFGIQPLAALQNLVGGNSRSHSENENISRKGNSPIVNEQITKQKLMNHSVDVPNNSNGQTTMETLDRNTNSMTLGGGACTITRIPAKEVELSPAQSNNTGHQGGNLKDSVAISGKVSNDSTRTLTRSESLHDEHTLSDSSNLDSEASKPRPRSLSCGNDYGLSFGGSQLNAQILGEKINNVDQTSMQEPTKQGKEEEAGAGSSVKVLEALNSDHISAESKDEDLEMESQSLEDLVSNEVKDKSNSEKHIKVPNGESYNVEESNVISTQESSKYSQRPSLYYDSSFEWENLKCGACNISIIGNEPKLMPCLHTMCGPCFSVIKLEQKEDDDVIDVSPCMQCPVCKRSFPHSDVIDHVLLLEKGSLQSGASKVDTFSCTSCSDEETATGFCVDCSEWLCETCIQAHKRVKVTKDHSIKSKDEACLSSESTNSTTLKQLQFCQAHTKESLNLYCVTCNQLTCRDCQLREHRDHKYKFASEMATQVKERFQSLSLFIQKKKTYITSAKTLVAERKIQLAKRKESVKADIQRLVDTFTDIIKQRGVILNEQLSEICKTKEDQLDKKTDVLHHLGNQADYCVSFLEKVLESSSELAILYSKKVVYDYVMKVDKDSPDGNLYNRFKSKLNNGDDICLRISSEARNLGKDLKEVGYLLVENRVYPTPSGESPRAKSRSSQASPVSDSSSPRPPSQPLPPVTAPVVPTPAVSSTNQLTTATSHRASPTVSAPVALPVPPAPPAYPSQNQPKNQVTPAPPTLTPMHNHNQQLVVQGNSQMHQKMRYNQCSPVNPPGLVRIQPKLGMGSNNQCNPSSISGPQINQVVPSFQRMPHITPQNCRPLDMPGIPSSTHHTANPFSETSHLRGLLGSSGFKMGSYPPMMRMPQHNNSIYGQHNVSTAQQFQHQQRILEQNRLVLPLNAQLAMAAVAMAPPMMSNPRVPINPPRTQSAINPGMHNSSGTNGNSVSRDVSRISPQTVHTASKPLENGTISPSWHIPQSSLMVVATSSFSNSQNATTTTVSSSDISDNSYKIMLGASKSVSVTPLVHPKSSVTEETHSSPVTITSTNSFRPILPRGEAHETSNHTSENVTKATVSVLNSMIEDFATKEESNHQNTSPVSSTVPSNVAQEPPNRNSESNPPKRDPSDPNDDWCAVCWDGGDLICCDYCPKVFHMTCHIPALSHLPRPNEKWQCMICRDLTQIPDDDGLECPGDKRKFEAFTPKQLKIAQRILLELYCNYEASQPFRELVDRELTEYYEVIQHPMALEIIKKKLKPDFISHYTDLHHFVRDVKLIFKNCYEFNPSETEIHQNARILEDFFNELLAKWLPNFDFTSDIEPSITPSDSKRPKLDIGT